MDALWRLWRQEAATNHDEFVVVLIGNLVAVRELRALGATGGGSE